MSLETIILSLAYLTLSFSLNIYFLNINNSSCRIKIKKSGYLMANIYIRIMCLYVILV